MTVLATVEQQNRAVAPRAVGSIRAGYVDEWATELRRRGLQPNGDYSQQRVGRAALDWRPPRRTRPPLEGAARAFDIALAAGLVRYTPVPEVDRIAYDFRAAALARLPKSAKQRAVEIAKRRR